MDKTESKNSILPRSLSIIFVGVIVGVFWMNINFGVSCADEYYQMMMSKEPKTFALALLSFDVGHIWGSIFGFTVLSFRLFSIFLSILTYLIVIYPLYKHTHDITLCLFTFMVMCITKMHPFWTMYSVTFLLCAASAVLMYYWVQKPSIKLLAIVGVAGALTTLSRVPCLLVLFVEMFIVLMYRISEKDSLKKTLTDLAVLVGSYAVILVLLVTLLCGSIGGYLELTKAYHNEEHSAMIVLMQYYNNLFFNFIVPGMCTCGFYAIYRYLRDRVYAPRRWWCPRSVFCVLFFVGVVIFCLYINILSYIHSLRIYVIIITLLSLVSYYTFAHRGGDLRHNVRVLLNIIIVVCFATVPMAWSNTGFRCMPFAIFTPLVVLLLIKANAIRYLRFYIIILSVICFAYVFVLLRSKWYYSNPPLRDLDTPVEICGQKFYTKSSTASYVKDVDDLRQNYERQGKSVMFVGGPDRFIFEYMAGRMDNKYDFDEGLNHTGYADRTMSFLNDNPRDILIVLLTIGHDVPEDDTYKNPTHTEKQLVTNGYRLIRDCETHRVYEHVSQ